MKSLFSYQIGEKCGKLIQEHYINGVPFPSSEVMELGNYFEYICTGSLARDGHKPEPQLTKKGEPTSKYKIMDEQKVNFDNIMAKYGFKIIEIDHDFKSEHFSGIADVIAEKDGKLCIIDIKTTGLIDNRWEETGWHNDKVANNEKLMIQAKHYKMLALEEFGIYNIPFYFIVFSNTNAIDCKIFEVDCSEETLHQHEINSYGAKDLLEETLANGGFKTKPSYKECLNCPLKKDCKDFTSVPLLHKINL